MPTIEMRPADRADEAALARFAAGLAPGEPARAVLAGWKRYAASHPTGMRAWVATTDADERGPARVAAFVALRGVPARIDGSEHVFAELLAASAHPLDRGTTRGPRLVAQLTGRALDEHCTLERDIFAYALASDAGWRLLRHGLEIEVMRRQPELVLALDAPPAERDARSALVQALPAGVREVGAFDERVLALYDRCSGAWRASCIRDAATLAWRFPADGPYRRLVVGDHGGELAAMAVAAPDRDGGLAVLDWLLPADDADAGELLHRGVVALARALGLDRVRASLPPWSADFARFQERSYRVAPTRHFVLARSAHAKLDVWWLRDHWWNQPFDVARPL
jgi:hypothetical protein